MFFLLSASLLLNEATIARCAALHAANLSSWGQDPHNIGDGQHPRAAFYREPHRLPQQ